MDRLNKRMQKFFRDWAQIAEPRALSFDKMWEPPPPSLVPFFWLVHTFDSNSLVHELDTGAFNHLESLGVWIFKNAIRETRRTLEEGGASPRTLDTLEDPKTWINVWEIGLDPMALAERALLEPESRPQVLQEAALEPKCVPVRETIVSQTPSFGEVFQKNAKRLAEQPAVLAGDSQLTYGELHEIVLDTVERIRDLLQGSSSWQERVVASSDPPGIGKLISFLATLCAGGTFACVETTDDSSDVARVMQPRLISRTSSSENHGKSPRLDIRQNELNRKTSFNSSTMLNNGMQRASYVRHISYINQPVLQILSHLSLMRSQYILDMAIRLGSPRDFLAPDEEVVFDVVSATNVHIDWLLPFVFGGMLIIPSDGFTLDSKDLKRKRERESLILAAKPEHLLPLQKRLGELEADALLAMGRPLRDAEKWALVELKKPVIDGGNLWTHDEFWA